jgi:methanogenic corrinoid protein MtbC1
MNGSTSKLQRSPNEAARYRIGAVATLTGISSHALRVWERRYGMGTSLRSDGGSRLYTDEDVARLRLIKTLLDYGHGIGAVAGLPSRDLERIVASHRDAEMDPGVDAGTRLVRDRFLRAIEAMDVQGAELALSRALVALSPRDFVCTLVSDLMGEIGSRWERGDFSVAHEHAASAVLRTQLSALLASLSSHDRHLTAVCATLSGDQHELGLLASAVIAALEGYRVIYLGASLPTAEIARAATQSRARVVVLSVVIADASVLRSQLRDLRKRLNLGTDIVVGGRGVPSGFKLPASLIWLKDLVGLETTLRGVAALEARRIG